MGLFIHGHAKVTPKFIATNCQAGRSKNAVRSGFNPSNRKSNKDNKMIGKIRYINAGKQFAFLIKSDGKELFVHFSEIQNFAKLEIDQMVEYTLGSYRGRECATKVFVIEPATKVLNEDGVSAPVAAGEHVDGKN